MYLLVCWLFEFSSLFVGCLGLGVFLWLLWCLGSVFPISLFFFDLICFGLQFRLVNFVSSICLCMVRVVQFGLIWIWLNLFGC